VLHAPLQECAAKLREAVLKFLVADAGFPRQEIRCEVASVLVVDLVAEPLESRHRVVGSTSFKRHGARVKRRRAHRMRSRSRASRSAATRMKTVRRARAAAMCAASKSRKLTASVVPVG